MVGRHKNAASSAPVASTCGFDRIEYRDFLVQHPIPAFSWGNAHTIRVPVPRAAAALEGAFPASDACRTRDVFHEDAHCFFPFVRGGRFVRLPERYLPHYETAGLQ